ncbi:MAG: MBL fold metallo-hydrolase, partial [Beijerinckiaceae bacterium]
MNVDRRTMIAGTIAATAAGLSDIRPSEAAAPMATSQAPGFYRYKIGDLQVTAINDGFFKRPLDGLIRNAEVSAVQKSLEEAGRPTDGLT